MLADDIHRVEQLLEQDDSKGAEIVMDKICKANPNSESFKILNLKSQILLRNKEFSKCQEISNKALELSLKNGKRNQISESLKILSMSYFRLKDYNNALKYIIYSNSYDDFQNPEIKMFKNMVIRKYEKANNINDDNEILKIEKDILSKPLKTINEKNDKDIKINEQPLDKKLAIKPIEQQFKMDWFDSGKAIEISIFIKKINKNSIISKITPNSIDFKFKDSENFDYEYKIDNLFSNINENESYFKVYGTKLEIILIKKESITWNKLEKTQLDNSNDDDIKLSQIPKDESPASSLPSAYTSTTKKDWSKFKLEDDDEKEEEESQDPEGFFKKLYENADDDAKRAMMKSFLESNGTSLSTDWKDVGSRDVKPYQDEKDA